MEYKYQEYPESLRQLIVKEVLVCAVVFITN
jgi:hypothetical protein